MSDFTRGNPAGTRPARTPASSFNPFLLFFTLFLAGIPLSYFVEMLDKPSTRHLHYWAEVNACSHVPYGSIKSAGQRLSRRIESGQGVSEGYYSVPASGRVYISTHDSTQVFRQVRRSAPAIRP